MIQIQGLNKMGEVVAKPGDDISLKCLALSKFLKASCLLSCFHKNELE
ncbi:unnamed protein product [Trichobilharzia regenti]|nr:unnamed protein product [Trichobilharzia regenti]